MIADEVADAILFLRGLGMHLCAEPSMSLCPTFIPVGMPYFVPVPSPPEAHEGTVGDQTLRERGRMGKALETRVPRALEGLLPRCD